MGRGGKGVWGPKGCVGQMVPRNLSIKKFHFFPLKKIFFFVGGGEEWGQGNTHAHPPKNMSA